MSVVASVTLRCDAGPAEGVEGGYYCPNIIQRKRIGEARHEAGKRGWVRARGADYCHEHAAAAHRTGDTQ